MARPVFILASSSSRRLSLLADMGVVPDKVMAAEVDELPRRGELPRQQAERLALEKLQAVLPSCDAKTIVLAADTVVGCGRRILPKAKTPENVREFLNLLSGRRHHVYTGLAVRTAQGKILHRVVDSVVTFHRLTPQDVEAYVKCGEGIGKAGGYAIQGRAAAHIRYISGSHSNIVGLPLFEVAQMFRHCGYPL